MNQIDCLIEAKRCQIVGLVKDLKSICNDFNYLKEIDLSLKILHGKQESAKDDQ